MPHDIFPPHGKTINQWIIDMYQLIGVQRSEFEVIIINSK